MLSGVVGINASKKLPVGKLTSPIRMELYLADNDDAIYYGTAGVGCTWQITNCEFEACYVELQDGSLDMQLAPGQEEYISTITYKQSSTYLPAATAGEFAHDPTSISRRQHNRFIRQIQKFSNSRTRSRQFCSL